jgi:hypothetical protein
MRCEKTSKTTYVHLMIVDPDRYLSGFITPEQLF